MSFSTYLPDDSKMHSSVRTFILKPMEGKKVTAANGLTDSRLFTGENKLIAFMDPHSSLWTLKYEQGIVPQSLQQRFTGINKVKEFITGYYAKRNIIVEEMLDVKDAKTS